MRTSMTMAFLLVATVCPMLMTEAARADVIWYVDDDVLNDCRRGHRAGSRV